MESFGEAMGAILSKLAQFLGIKPSDKHRIELMEQKLTTEKASNIDLLESLKAKIKQLEAQVLLKKKEFDSARGDSQRIVAGEIERLFRDIDRLRGQENVIASNIERISATQAKLQEWKAAQAKGLAEGELDSIAIDLQEAFEGLKVTDRASRDLKDVEYHAPQVSPVNSEKRMAEITGEQETTGSLSTETVKRLKQLEIDES